MPLIMIFQKAPGLLSVGEISELMKEMLGYGCEPMAGTADPPTGELHRGRLYVHLEDLGPDEGQPEVQYEAIPRLDRDPSLQALIDEIVEQDPELDETLNQNARDILITFPDTDAAADAGYAVAYVVAAEAESGLLLPSFDEEAETLWFSDAEEFYTTVFEGDDEEWAEVIIEDGEFPDDDEEDDDEEDEDDGEKRD